jgi:transposase-like protein
MAANKKWTDEMKKDVVERYKRGERAQAIADHYDTHTSTIYEYIKGVPKHNMNLSHKRINKVKKITTKFVAPIETIQASAKPMIALVGSNEEIIKTLKALFS